MQEAQQAALQEKQRELAEHMGYTARGDARYGFLNMQSRKARIRQLQVEIAAMQAAGASAGPAAEPGASDQVYTSKNGRHYRRDSNGNVIWLD